MQDEQKNDHARSAQPQPSSRDADPRDERITIENILRAIKVHRRHVELSPGIGLDVQTYALACYDELSEAFASFSPRAGTVQALSTDAPELATAALLNRYYANDDPSSSPSIEERAKVITAMLVLHGVLGAREAVDALVLAVSHQSQARITALEQALKEK